MFIDNLADSLGLIYALATAIGLPVLLTLLYRLHVVRASTLGAKTFKGLEDQLSSLETLEQRHLKALENGLSKRVSVRAPLTDSDFKPQTDLLDAIRQELSKLVFCSPNGDHRHRDATLEALGFTFDNDLSTLPDSILLDYEVSLKDEQFLFGPTWPIRERDDPRDET